MSWVPGFDGNSAAAKGARSTTGDVRRQLARILRDPEFASSPRLAALLTHVVERTLAGRAAEIKEATIGVEVFQRSPAYDTRADSVVRTEARRLREKLAHYYLHAGQEDPVRIEIPKGSYVPVFQTLQAPPAEPLQRNPWRRAAVGAAVLAAMAVALVGWRLLSKPLAGAGRAPRVLAILPFENLDAGSQTRYVSDGITEDLERDLSRVPGLRLRARPPDGWLTAGGGDYAALARKLHADVLLAGAVAPAASGRQVRASLIRGTDGSILWTDRFPLGVAPLAVERQIETGALAALSLRAPVARRPPENPKAHDLFLQGRSLWAGRTREDNDRAIGLFRQALAIDPDYALAYMGIADAYGLMAVHNQIAPETAVRAGEEAASKAIALDPSLAEAHAALGLLKCAEWDWRSALDEYQRAIALNPGYDRAYVRAGVVRFYLGDFAGAERLIRESETRNPYSTALPLIRAELYYYARRYRDTLDLAREVERIDPQDRTARLTEAHALLAVGQVQEALRIVERVIPSGSGTAAERAEVAPYLYVAGRRRDALQLVDAAAAARRHDFVAAYDLAALFAGIHERDQTLDWIERSLAERSPDLPSARWDPVFDFVRDDARFVAVMRRMFPATLPPPG